MFTPIVIDFNFLVKRLSDLNNILQEFHINTESIQVFGLAIGGKMRWDDGLDLLVDVKNPSMSYWDVELCNEMLSVMLGVNVSVYTKDILIEPASAHGINQELVPLKTILNNLNVFNTIHQNDLQGLQHFVKHDYNCDINTLFVSHYGRVTLLNYAIITNSPNMVNALLDETGIDVSIVDGTGLTAAQCLIRRIYKNYLLTNTIDHDMINALSVIMNKTTVALGFSDRLYLETLSHNPGIAVIYQRVIKQCKEMTNSASERVDGIPSDDMLCNKCQVPGVVLKI